MKETPQQRQEIVDSINKRFGTSPEFAKEVEDYFSKPRVVVNIPAKDLSNVNRPIQEEEIKAKD